MQTTKKSTIILSAIVLALLLFAAYYYVVLPKQQAVESKEQSIATLQTQVTTVQQQIQQQKELMAIGETANEFELRQKVPADRAIDKLLRDLEEIDLVAGTRVSTITFNNYDSLVASSTLQDPLAETNTAADETANEGTATEDGQPAVIEPTDEALLPVTTITKELLPAALQLVTLNLTIDAPTYEALIAFIQEIEQLERTVRIDSLQYTLPSEESLNREEPVTTVQATVTLTTYYFVEEGSPQ